LVLGLFYLFIFLLSLHILPQPCLSHFDQGLLHPRGFERGLAIEAMVSLFEFGHGAGVTEFGLPGGHELDAVGARDGGVLGPVHDIEEWDRLVSPHPVDDLGWEERLICAHDGGELAVLQGGEGDVHARWGESTGADLAGHAGGEVVVEDGAGELGRAKGGFVGGGDGVPGTVEVGHRVGGDDGLDEVGAHEGGLDSEVAASTLAVHGEVGEVWGDVAAHGAEVTGQVGLNPGQEVPDVGEDIQAGRFGEEAVVGADADGGVTSCVVQCPLGSPVGVDGMAGDEVAAVEVNQDGPLAGVDAFGENDPEGDLLAIDNLVRGGGEVELGEFGVVHWIVCWYYDFGILLLRVV
jgi:hypothetical protein